MKTRVKGDARPFNVEVVSLTGASEPFSVSEALSEAEQQGIQERFAAQHRNAAVIIGLKGSKRVFTTMILKDVANRINVSLCLTLKQRLRSLGCDMYICVRSV